MSYDQAYWHTDTCIENGLPEENAATHITAYVRWCIERKLLSKELEQEDMESLRMVRSGQLSAAKYFEENMDWKLGEWSLNEEGNWFATDYYESYLKDLEELFPSIIYGEWKAVDFVKLAEFLDSRFAEFKNGALQRSSAKNKPWWRFW